jgi:hypothetical protein
MPVWAIVLTSAGTAALASSIISLVGQALERRSRRRELTLTKALEMADQRVKDTTELAMKTGAALTILDTVIIAETYYRWLTHLMDHGELPPDAHPHRTKAEKLARGQTDAE